MKIQTLCCPDCGQSKTLEVTKAEAVNYYSGALIQNAFPNLSADDRERLITGYCPACWNNIFKPRNK